MQLSDLRIIFLGTPEFAAFHLQTILDAKCQVVAVITNPDKPSGRGLKFESSAVKKLATKYGIPCLEPTNLKNPEFLQRVHEYKADLQVVVAFRMLPKLLWSMPPLGTINMHASYLPNYRGAAPIQRVIMDGADYTGVTTFQLCHEIDTGAVLLREKIPLEPKIDGGTLHNKLMHAGSQLLLSTLQKLVKGELKAQEQQDLVPNSKDMRTAPKITNADCEINWHVDTLTIERQIRALAPYPGAFTKWQGQKLKILQVNIGQKEEYLHIKESGFSAQAGTWQILNNKQGLRCFTRDGFLDILQLQIAGKKVMYIVDFLNGRQNLPMSGIF